jgi:signal transduction histidine kinase
MSDGSLWFATLRGVASIRPSAGPALDYENRIAPLTAIEDVLIEDQPAPADQALTVPPGHDRIAIHYAGLSFRAPQKLRFRYKLEGFDRDWIEAGARRTAFYTNLPAGSYRFIAYASNGDGVWSELPGAFSFTIRPHFYRTIWFYGVVLLLLGLFAYAIYRSRVRSVEAQYQAVLAERNRIAREIHDTLAQGYVGISVQLEVASRLLQSSKEAAAQQLEKTKEYVRSSLADARSSIWNLRSAESGAASETLPARLAAAVNSRQQPNGSAPTLRFNVHGSFRPVDNRDRRVEDELLRIAQEAVSNALRHAAAGAITVVLSYDTSWLKLRITDDGKGFDPPTVGAGHYGLQGMHERAAAIGARLEIDSKSGAGTTVELTYQLAGRKAPQ